MNKLDVLKAVSEFLPTNGNLDDFYSVNIWGSNNTVNLQGRYSSALADALRPLFTLTVGVNGYLNGDCTVYNDDGSVRVVIKVTLT